MENVLWFKCKAYIYIYIHKLKFTDDIDLLENVIQLRQRMANVLQAGAERFLMHINGDISKSMTFSIKEGDNQPVLALTLNNNSIERAKSFIYLCSKLALDNNMTVDISHPKTNSTDNRCV